MRDRYSSTGVMILGIILGAVGAILAYAVTATSNALNIHRVGVIILIVGIAIFLVGLAVGVMGNTGGGPDRTQGSAPPRNPPPGY